jgi:hypothetical protein
MLSMSQHTESLFAADFNNNTMHKTNSDAWPRVRQLQKLAAMHFGCSAMQHHYCILLTEHDDHLQWPLITCQWSLIGVDHQL